MYKNAIVAAALATFAATTAAQADKLDTVLERGVLKCGIHEGKAGFATPDTTGAWTGFDIDFCKALAAAVLGDASKVEYSTTTSKNRLTALAADEIDVLSRSTTFTITRDTQNGVDLTSPWFYDGQGFLVKRSLGIKSALELNGATICTYPGTTSERNVNDYFEANNMTYTALIIEGSAEAKSAYLADRCDVITNDRSALASDRVGMQNPEDHVLLPEVISKEPLGPFVKGGENRWREIVAWTAMALIEAEELGVTQANVETMAANGGPAVKRLLGTDGTIGEGMSLRKSWAFEAIKAVGNYGEIFERNLGKDTPLALERGLNAPWSKGGILYAYPFR